MSVEVKVKNWVQSARRSGICDLYLLLGFYYSLNKYLYSTKAHNEISCPSRSMMLYETSKLLGTSCRKCGREEMKSSSHFGNNLAFLEEHCDLVSRISLRTWSAVLSAQVNWVYGFGVWNGSHEIRCHWLNLVCTKYRTTRLMRRM